MSPPLLGALLLLVNMISLVMAVTLPTRDSGSLDTWNVKRQNNDGYNCCPWSVGTKTLSRVDRSDIINGINYLTDTSSITGKLGNYNNDCLAPAGGCSRVSCYGNAAIYACNDNTNKIDLHTNCGVFGSAASDLASLCPGDSMCGQIFSQVAVPYQSAPMPFYVYMTLEDCSHKA
ncbi:uncharacterized protein PAC_13292 [Phialocephala subalpina]|uniref:Uncharacterized protein n=1 Tax=Phialocephala subalpina TaxID=576137 RepID=A0A1L7XED6_9HELO|nr:uncharacterized protein PAC_13292 [Phialocephala subalpina]